MKLYFLMYRVKFFVCDVARFARAIWNGQLSIDRNGVVSATDVYVEIR